MNIFVDAEVRCVRYKMEYKISQIDTAKCEFLTNVLARDYFGGENTIGGGLQSRGALFSPEAYASRTATCHITLKCPEHGGGPVPLCN